MSPLKILIIDNYDSFTYNLYDYFLQLDTECTVVRNDEIPFEKVHEIPFDAIVLSPGPKKPKDAGFMMELIEYYYDKVSVLGICLGHQGIGKFFGASLQKASEPMHGKTSILRHEQHSLFKNLPQDYKVMRYHSLLLKELNQTPLISIAQSDENENMAIAHPQLPLYGVQFHPESILTEYGLQLLSNWLAIARQHLLRFREMIPEEAASVSDLIIQSHNAANKSAVSPEGQIHLVEDIFATEKLLERQQKGNCILVATIKEELLGMAECRSPGHLKLLFVSPESQGLGIGWQLMQEAVRWTKQHFPNSTFLSVSAAPKALNFYLKFGFEQTDDLVSKNGISYIPMQLNFK